METGDLVQVRVVPIQSPVRHGTHPVRPGEILQCIDRSESDTLVARPNGTQFRVSHALGNAVEVRLYWDPTRGWLPDEMKEPRPL
jgi:hypothetical protein